jgi:predicted nucleic acid-binding Zn ribbon protein
MKEKLRNPEVYECWPEVAGPEACRHSRVVGFNNCVLYVEVDSAPWLQMLATFQKPELLRGLREMMRGVRVRDIRFKIGSAAGPPAGASERKPWPRQPNPPTTHEASKSSPA